VTDPYREVGVACPQCKVSLRGFGDRAVCDQCGGMMIKAKDLEAQIGLGELYVEDDGGEGHPCPLCERTMAKATLRIEADKCRGAQRCTQHGVWLQGGMLEVVLEGFGRRHRTPRRGGGVDTSPGGGMVMFGHVQTYMPGGTGGGGALAVQNWWMRTKPHVHTPYASTLAGKTLACPSCGEPLQLIGERWPCARCDGAFVENAALVEMMSEMRGKPWDLPAGDGTVGRRNCPACAAAMTVQMMEGVEVDRCAHDGVWFDAGELASALHHTAPAKGWLKRLLR
jgi:Zn-finger nucleic acid-binding protein